MYRGAVFPAPDGFKVLNPLPVPDQFENHRRFALAIVWNQSCHRLADDFFGAIAE
jgi:hypothetical protein